MGWRNYRNLAKAFEKMSAITVSSVLQDCWDKHRKWSAFANRKKSLLTAWRKVALVLGVMGALAATLAAQLQHDYPLFARGLCFLGGLVLTTTPFVAKGFNRDQVIEWTRARSASEGLKKEAFLYLAKVEPYSGSNAEAVLTQKAQEITNNISNLNLAAAGLRPDPEVPPEINGPDDYVQKRIDDQVRYYESGAASRSDYLNGCNFSALALAILAAVIGYVAGFSGDSNFGMWAAVATTIAGAFTAFAAAARYQHEIINYLYTADRLKTLRSAFSSLQAKGSATSSDFSKFVLECESVISIETQGWMAAQSANPPATGSSPSSPSSGSADTAPPNPLSQY